MCQAWPDDSEFPPRAWHGPNRLDHRESRALRSQTNIAFSGLSVALLASSCGASPGTSTPDASVPDGTGTGGNGAGGAAGSGGAAGGGSGGVDGDAGPADCIDLSHGKTEPYDFRVVGSGFDAYDGETARAVVVFVNHVGYGLGETTIRNGSFEIVLPKTNEPYNMYGLYIDRGKDDACTQNVDPFWQMASGAVFQDVNWEINPQTPPGLGLECNINGLFDLTQPLPCPG